MPQGKNKKALKHVTKEEMERLHHEEEMTQSEIAAHHGVTQSAIYQAFKRLGVQARSRAESIRLASKKGRYSGDSNGMWNGGKTTMNGYVLVRAPDHHRADCRGYVREHIMVWEKANRTKLPKGWHVHHLNGIKDDNRPENLEAMTHEAHRQVLPKMLRRIARLESQVQRLRDENESLRSQAGSPSPGG